MKERTPEPRNLSQIERFLTQAMSESLTVPIVLEVYGIVADELFSGSTGGLRSAFCLFWAIEENPLFPLLLLEEPSAYHPFSQMRSIFLAEWGESADTARWGFPSPHRFDVEEALDQIREGIERQKVKDLKRRGLWL